MNRFLRSNTPFVYEWGLDNEHRFEYPSQLTYFLKYLSFIPPKLATATKATRLNQKDTSVKISKSTINNTKNIIKIAVTRLNRLPKN